MKKQSLSNSGFTSKKLGWCALAALAVAAILGLVWEILAPTTLPHLDQSKAALLPGTVIGLGLLLALLTYRRDTQNQSRDQQRKADEIAFEASRSGLNAAQSLLADRTNDRVKWILAARLLLKARELIETIKTPEISESAVLELALTRAKLFETLHCDAGNGVGSVGLPPAFFLGGLGWDHVGEGQEALLRELVDTEATTSAGWIELGVVNEEPQFSHLAAKSVVAVYDFIKEDSWQEDPFRKVRLWADNEMDILPGFDQGARQYVCLKRDYYVRNGEATRFEDPESV